MPACVGVSACRRVSMGSWFGGGWRCGRGVELVEFGDEAFSGVVGFARGDKGVDFALFDPAFN